MDLRSENNLSVKASTKLGYPWLRCKNRFSKGLSFQDACIWSQTKRKSNTNARTHTHTWSWAAKEGFILWVLESEISMALSRVSMAIPCTEIIRGDPRLRRRTQQRQIYISSRVGFPFFSLPFLLYRNGPCGPPSSTAVLPLPDITLSHCHTQGFL